MPPSIRPPPKKNNGKDLVQKAKEKQPISREKQEKIVNAVNDLNKDLISLKMLVGETESKRDKAPPSTRPPPKK